MSNRSEIFVDACFRCERPLTRIEIVKANGAAFCYQCAHYFSGFSNGDPWPDLSVRWLLPTIEDVEQLASEFMGTISSALNERPLQNSLRITQVFWFRFFATAMADGFFPNRD